MSIFADQLMIRYLTAANVDALLVPQADVNRQRVQSLLASVYEPRLLQVQSVDSVTVTTKTFQVPVVEPMTIRGTWEKQIPSSERSLAAFELPAIAETTWIDMQLDTMVSVRVSATTALLDAIASEDVSELSQQAFINKFQFLDLPSLMQAAGLSTYQALQADFPRLYRMHYADPAAYNPNDPAAARKYRLLISALFFATLDLEGALRQLTQGRRALNSLRPRPEGYEGGDILASSAWMGILPTTAFDPDVTPITQNDVTNLFAAGRFVAAFE